ncbi:nuclear transport factor 2 family protein [Lactococcus nasutitermitis]|uniref:Nuclear transport factor 2 family protein n=1 Tax=Lactococcus nasutitermitis TaxID=1652957 RepID=A0ABV9JBJ9_9LACT|nr:nuclear transport factor 2 family protein [Lactococcus nasutitermitis]
MKLPKHIEQLLAAQANFDSKAYAANFAETAVVTDEGETYRGPAEIETWNRMTNANYHTVYKPVNFDEEKNVLTVEVSGTFPGSPIVLHQHYIFDAAGKIIKWEVL